MKSDSKSQFVNGEPGSDAGECLCLLSRLLNEQQYLKSLEDTKTEAQATNIW